MILRNSGSETDAQASLNPSGEDGAPTGPVLCYATRVTFAAGVDSLKVMGVFSKWLQAEHGIRVPGAQLLADMQHAFAGDKRLATAVGSSGSSWAGRLTLPLWKTLEQRLCWALWQGDDAKLSLSVLGFTTGLNPAPGEFTNAGLKLGGFLRHQLEAGHQTAGARRKLEVGTADAWDSWHTAIHHLERRTPVVMPTEERGIGFPIDPNKLQSCLYGLADVQHLSPNQDWHKLQQAYGRRYLPYDGSALIFHPARSAAGLSWVPTLTVTGDEIKRVGVQAVINALLPDYGPAILGDMASSPAPSLIDENSVALHIPGSSTLRHVGHESVHLGRSDAVAESASTVSEIVPTLLARCAPNMTFSTDAVTALHASLYPDVPFVWKSLVTVSEHVLPWLNGQVKVPAILNLLGRQGVDMQQVPIQMRTGKGEAEYVLRCQPKKPRAIDFVIRGHFDHANKQLRIEVVTDVPSGSPILWQ